MNGTEQLYRDSAIAYALTLPHGEARAAVLHEAFEWIGTPWMHKNRVKGRGVDCGNYPGGVFAAVGLIDMPPLLEYSHQFWAHSDQELFRDEIEKYCIPLGRVEPEPGDIIGLKLRPLGPTICHVGVCVRYPQFIHARGGAFSKDGKVELGNLTGPYEKLWSGVWRLRRWVEPTVRLASVNDSSVS
jgi:cell wall-associated NlpC family hydrolase